MKNLSCPEYGHLLLLMMLFIYENLIYPGYIEITLNVPLKEIEKDGNKLVQCNYCILTMSNKRKYELEQHERTHTRPFICHLCVDFRDSTIDSLKTHLIDKHQLYNYHITSDNFDSAYGKLINLATEKPSPIRTPPPSSPQQRINMYKMKESLNSYIETTMTNGQPYYKCTHCCITNKRHSDMERHVRSHIKPFICHICDYRNAEIEGLHKHMAKKHRLMEFKLHAKNILDATHKSWNVYDQSEVLADYI